MRAVFSCFAALALTLSSVAAAGDVPRKGFMSGNADATRFSDTDVKTVALPPGAEVEVVAEAGDKVRVRYRTSFGWVDAALVSDQAPVAADTVELNLGGGAPGFR